MEGRCHKKCNGRLKSENEKSKTVSIQNSVDIHIFRTAVALWMISKSLCVTIGPYAFIDRSHRRTAGRFVLCRSSIIIKLQRLFRVSDLTSIQVKC